MSDPQTTKSFESALRALWFYEADIEKSCVTTSFAEVLRDCAALLGKQIVMTAQPNGMYYVDRIEP